MAIAETKYCPQFRRVRTISPEAIIEPRRIISDRPYPLLQPGTEPCDRVTSSVVKNVQVTELPGARDLFLFLPLLVLTMSLWVFSDARRIGVLKGQLKGLADLGAGGWFVVCLFLSIVAFPVYLMVRPRLKRLNSADPLPPGRG